MKIGIVGSGLVGSTAAYSLIMRGMGREIVLVDIDRERARAEAEDLFHAVPFAHPLTVEAGDYEALAGARVVIMAAGVNQKPGETRLELLERNTEVFRSVIPKICEHAPEAVLLVATNPVDLMTHITARIARDFDVPSHRVFGSGTTLDTARFRALLSRLVGVDSTHVHGYVVGEHGDSEVLTWSLTTIGQIPLVEFCRMKGILLTDEVKEEIDGNVRNAAYQIIQGKGATYYGVGSALARIVGNVLGNRRAIMTVCTPRKNVAGVKNVTVSLPHIVGGRGIEGDLDLPLNYDETAALARSAGTLRGILDDLESAGVL